MTEAGFFLNEKPVRALIYIRRNKESYGSEIASEIDTTFAHCVKIIGALEEHGLVEREKLGRKKIVTITDEGREIADELQKVVSALDPFEGEEPGSLEEVRL